MTIQKPMTLQEAKSIARHLGLTLRKVRSGDYRVNFRDGDETTAHYTDNLEDAVNTAVEMPVNESCERQHRTELERNLTSFVIHQRTACHGLCAVAVLVQEIGVLYSELKS